MLCLMTFVCPVCAQEGESQPIIEFEGNKYIIHMEQLNPDRELTLLDVLHMCP